MRHVKRQSDKGLPLYDTTDTFINERSEELVRIEGLPDDDFQVFRLKNEGAFEKYEYYPNEDRWVVWDRSGRRSYLGAQDSGISSTARIRHPDDLGTYCWGVVEDRDTNDNAILYEYDVEDNHLYPTKITYGAVESGDPSRWQTIDFTWEDREDKISDYRSTFRQEMGRRLKAIGTYSGSDLVRRYDFAYHPYAAFPLSTLASITMVGRDGVTGLPPAFFEFTTTEINGTALLQPLQGGDIQGLTLFDGGNGAGKSTVFDFNADGLPDLYESADTGSSEERYFQNVGSGSFEEIGLTEPARFLLVGGNTLLRDMDGDSVADLLVDTGSGMPDDYIYRRNLRGSWDTENITIVFEGPVSLPTALIGSSVRSSDADFDKRIDTLRPTDYTTPSGGVGLAFYAYLAGPDGTITGLSPDSYLVGFGPPPADNREMRLADMNGDRLDDVVLMGDTDTGPGIRYWPSRGFGRFDDDGVSGYVMDSSPDFGGNRERMLETILADVNGDGLADLLEWDSLGMTLYLNQNGSGFADAQGIDFDQRIDLAIEPVVVPTDINGDGDLEMLFQIRSTSPGDAPLGLYFADPTSCRPYLMTSATNGIGRTSSVEYRPSTVELLRDRAKGNEWESPPPFPVSVVAAIVESDGKDDYRFEFEYSDGYYDGAEKEFRGFGKATRIDVGDSTAPSLFTDFEFDTGREVEALKGIPMSQITRLANGDIFSSETLTWRTRTLFPGDSERDQRDVVFPYRTQVVQDVLELGRGAPVRLETESRFDNFGNETLRAEFGVVEDGDRSAGDDERLTLMTYTADSVSGQANWILNRPVCTEIRDETGVSLTEDDFSITGSSGIVSRSLNFFDDEMFQGSNENEVTRGNLTMTRDWVDPDLNIYRATLRQKYDNFGNVVTMIDALGEVTGGSPDANVGHFREVAYDLKFDTFPTTETIHIGAGSAPLAMSVDYDTGFGVVTRSTDFNANINSFDYDNWGRITSIQRPGDPDELPTLRFDYQLNLPAASGRRYNYVETQKRDKAPDASLTSAGHYHFSRQFVDGFGRNLMRKEEASEEDGVKVAVTGATTFNSRKEVREAFQPFFSNLSLGGDPLNDLLAFENIEAPGWSGSFHLNGTLVTLDISAAHKTSQEYDAMLRPSVTVHPDTTESQMEYEPLVVIQSDEHDTDSSSFFHGTPTVHHNDGLGRLIRLDELVKLDDDGETASTLNRWSTTYSYRIDDLLTEIIDANNNRKWMRYDGLQRMVYMNDPNRGELDHAYDAINMIGRSDAKEQLTSYTYDGANRLLTEDYLDEGAPFSAKRSPDVEYFYDAPASDIDLGNGSQGTARNTRGMLARVVDLAGEEATSYDDRNRIEWTVRAIPDPELGVQAAFQTVFDYDALDRITTVTYPDGDRLSMAYNDRTLLERLIGGASANTDATPDAISALDYLPSGQISRMLTGDGYTNTRAYDTRLRMNELHISGAEELLHYAYTFDPTSNITKIEDRRPASVVPSGSPFRNTQLYGYDDLYRLINAQYSLNNPDESIRDDGQISYRYNRIGNMVRQNSSIEDRDEQGRFITNLGTRQHGGAAGDYNRNGRYPGEPPGPHALTKTDNGEDTRAFPFDDNGNLTMLDDLTSLTWDFKDRLVAAENEVMRAEYRYDHTDRRTIRHVVSKNDDATTTTLYVNKWFEVREYEQPAKYLWNGESRVARATGTLDESAQRVQRWRLHEGWNIISVSIDSPGLATQLGIGTPRVRAAFRWIPGLMQFEEIIASSPLPPGTVLRIDMAEAAVVAAKGAYNRNAVRPVIAPGDYVGPALLEAVPVTELMPPEVTAAWSPDNTGDWRLAFPAAGSTLPAVMAPGEVLHARTETNIALITPGAENQIQYYHQDHLGSTNFIIDGSGAILEQAVYYPYGHPRVPKSIVSGTERTGSKYGFTQKERDIETGLQYFEARYYNSLLGSFVSSDPITTLQPEKRGTYYYGNSNPMLHIDPSGLDAENIYFILFGGADDSGGKFRSSNSPAPVEDRLTGYLRKKGATNIQYFAHDDGHAAARYIKDLPLGSKVHVIGHSLGSDEAVGLPGRLSQMGSDKTISNLVLLDPFTHTRAERPRRESNFRRKPVFVNEKADKHTVGLQAAGLVQNFYSVRSNQPHIVNIANGRWGEVSGANNIMTGHNHGNATGMMEDLLKSVGFSAFGLTSGESQ